MAWPRSGRDDIAVEQTPGVIETVGTAFVLLNKRPYMLIPPVLLDIFLWLGTRLSLKPLTDRLVGWVQGSSSVDTTTIDQLHSLGKSFNLFELLSVSMPTFVTQIGADAIAGASHRTIDGLQWWALLLVGFGLLLAGLAVGMAYLTLLGYLVRGEGLAVLSFGRAALRNVVRTYAYYVLLIGLAMLILFPLVLLSGMLLIFGVSILPFVTIVLALAAMWAYVLLYFAQDAIVISQVGPARAIYMSYNVVRANFWPCIGLIVVSLILQIGTPLALVAFTRNPWAVPLAFVLHAYILTGVAAAALLFYRDRARKLRVPTSRVTTDHTS
jgi:hypothetical protein